MTFYQIFSKDYLFDPTPPYESNLYIPLLALFGLLLFWAILTRFMKKEQKKLINRYYYSFITMGISGLIYLFSRYEGLPWLGSRFVLLVIISILIIWIIYNTITLLFYLPKYKKEIDTKKRYEKYLPKQKSVSARHPVGLGWAKPRQKPRRKK